MLHKTETGMHFLQNKVKKGKDIKKYVSYSKKKQGRVALNNLGIRKRETDHY